VSEAMQKRFLWMQEEGDDLTREKRRTADECAPAAADC
jgi:hypothetical protein